MAMAVDNLDILVTGHTHKHMTMQGKKLFIDRQNNKVTVKPFVCVTATSWLDYGGYALRKMLPPTGHAEQEILLRANKKEVRVIS